MKALSYLPACFSLAIPVWCLTTAFTLTPGSPERIQRANSMLDSMAASAVLFSATGLIHAATGRPEIN